MNRSEPPTRRRWRLSLKRAARGWGILAGAVTLLALAAESRNRALVGVAGGLLAVAGILFQAQLRRRSTPGLARFLIAVLLVAGGAGTLFLWSGGGQTAGRGFLGLVTVLFGLFELLALWRGNRLGAPQRGIVVAVLGVTLVVAGLVGLGYRSPGWALLLLLAGIVVLVLGVPLVSEDFLRLLAVKGPSSGMVAPLGAVGLVGVVVAVAAFMQAGAPFRYAFYVALAIVVIVGSLASSSDADVVIIVIAVMLVWSLLPRDARPLLLNPNGRKTLVSLGDSYISGEGAKSFYEGTNSKGSNQCRRAPSAYSPQLTKAGNARGFDSILFLACSGAKARDIVDHPQYEGEPLTDFLSDEDGKGLSQLRQYDALTAKNALRPDMVVVSIGGNDAGFGNIVQACVFPGDCAETGQTWLDGLAGVSDAVGAAYGAIRKQFPNVPVLAIPYPLQLNPAGCPGSLLTAKEHVFLTGFVKELNSVLRHQAEKVRFHYVDTVQGAFEAAHVRICDGPFKNAAVNFFAANPVSGVLESSVNPQNWLHDSFHPNLTGQQVLERTISEWIAGRALAPMAGPDPLGAGPYVPAKIENVMSDATFGHCASVANPSDSCQFDDKGALNLGRWTKSKAVEFARRIAIPSGGAVFGAWLAWMSVISLWRRAGWWRELKARLWSALTFWRFT